MRVRNISEFMLTIIETGVVVAPGQVVEVDGHIGILLCDSVEHWEEVPDAES